MFFSSLMNTIGLFFKSSIDKLKQSLHLFFKSSVFIGKHKKLLIFPLLTGFFTVGTIVLYECVYFQLYKENIFSSLSGSELQKNRQLDKKELYANNQERDSHYSSAIEFNYSTIRVDYILFLYFILFSGMFFSAFFNSALSWATTQAFLGSSISIRLSIKHSLKRIFTLLLWSSSAFFIWLMVSFFKGDKEGSQNKGILAFLGHALDFAWYIATFLVIPVIAHENQGAFFSIRKSAELMLKNWGKLSVDAIVLVFLKKIILVIPAILLSCICFIAFINRYYFAFVSPTLFLGMTIFLIGIIILSLLMNFILNPIIIILILNY